MNNCLWTQRSRQSVWHPCSQMQQYEAFPPIPIAHAQGVWLTDFEGNRYIDGISSWWVNLFGHGHPDIKQAIHHQLDRLEHIMLAGFTHQPVIELSERLAQLTGLGHAFYASDGASAVEIALKMSFQYWINQGNTQKNRFICLDNSYHGETIGALAVTDIPLFSQLYGELIRPAWRVLSPDSRLARQEESPFEQAQRAIESLRTLLAQSADTVAAVIVEPLVQAAAGMGMHDAYYLQALRQLCDHYQIHLIADEIAVGFGRTGSLFAFQQAAILPDFLCLSKGITGGFLPLSCVLTRDQIFQAFYHADLEKGFLHSHSYTGNPLACAAALAVLDIFENQDIICQNHKKAEIFCTQMAPLSERKDIQHFRHLGMIWAFDAIHSKPNFAKQFAAIALKKGCLLRPIGNTVYFMPPYTITQKEMQHLIHATASTLDEIATIE